MKYRIESQSDRNVEEALEFAMADAARHLSDENDLLISIVEKKVTRGGVHHVAIDVEELPPGSHVRDRGVEPMTKAQEGKIEERAAKRTESAVALKKRIVDHFRMRRGRNVDSARLHMHTLTEIQIMGQIEQEFFNSSNPVRGAFDADPPKETKKPEPAHHDREPD